MENTTNHSESALYEDRWSLDVLYKGTDDPKLTEDLQKADELAKTYKELACSLGDASSQTTEEQKEKLLTILRVKEDLQTTLRRIGSYFSLRKSANASDQEGSRYLNRIHGLGAGLSIPNVQFEKYVASVKDPEPLFTMDPLLASYRFYFEETAKSTQHRLSDEAEDIFAKMNLSGGMAWSDLFGYVTSTLKCPYNGSILTLPGIRALASDEDKNVRKNAYLAELKAYDSIKAPIAFALNSIKQQVNTECEIRGYESPLTMTLVQSRMERSTLDAMFSAIDDALPKFRQYLKRKAECLGDSNALPWYDIAAPMGEAVSHKYSIEEAHDYLVSHFEGFAPDLAQMIDTAFKERWIDFYPRDGKRGGAFCSNLPFVKESRVLTNYTGDFSDIVTLAHELGHAYHGQQIQDHRPLNTSYSMPVAETASNFNELIVMNDAIAKATGAEKLRLIESQLQDCTQIIVDIYSRFLFEDEVFRRRKEEFLYPDQLEDIMIRAQKTAFGDGLDPNWLHPYMWCNKVHYYSTGRSYYNFPYAFGGLFSRGLYARYQEQGSDFVPLYRQLLHQTTVATCEDAAKIAGLDLTDKAFWASSLKVITDGIDTFLEQTKSDVKLVSHNLSDPHMM